MDDDKRDETATRRTERRAPALRERNWGRERRTSNAQRRTSRLVPPARSELGVRCWAFDVRCFLFLISAFCRQPLVQPVRAELELCAPPPSFWGFFPPSS